MHSAIPMAIVLVCAAAVALGAAPGLDVGPVEKVTGGFQFTEGPMWHPDGYLVFSDIPADTIYRLKDGEKEVYRRPSGNSNGLAFDEEGRLLACEHGTRTVSRTLEDDTVIALASEYGGKRLNSPNDLVVRSDGSIYFTDPPYGVDEEDRELDFQGVYRISPVGEPQLLLKDFERPNGLAFSPDQRVLYIADTAKHHVRAFDVQLDGSLTNDRTFVQFEEPDQLRPDGMKVDVEGNLYVAGFEGVEVFAPDGEHRGTIVLPERPANLAFGDADGRTLYVTARTSVYKVRVAHPGAVFARRFGLGEGE
jgi:gluconolactonase